MALPSKNVILASTLVCLTVGFVLWRKRKRSFIKVGKISKLLFFPVKSMKSIEVKKGRCTPLGFEVDGLLDRSFMLINSKTSTVVTQREIPRLVLFSCNIKGNNLIITAPSGQNFNVVIKDSISENDVIVDCRIFTDGVKGVDCGDDVASFLETHTEFPGIRLVKQFSTLPQRKYLKNIEYFKQLRKDHPAGFQDVGAFHVLSQASIDDLNSKLEGQQVSVLNFRPNILVEGCEAFAEDSWKYIMFNSGVLLSNMILCTRCLLTTNKPSSGELTQKEPLVTLRKYRIPKDPELLKKMGSVPCFGLLFGAVKTGEISLGDDVFAVIGPLPAMQVK